ncbi:MAG: thiamine pyrophosphate-dependent enzyme, partial [Rhodospirillales bacterium]
GAGPQFIECLVYRWREHVGPNEDYDAGYRSLDEAAPWKKNDQVARLAAMIDDADRAAIDAEIEQEIETAVAFAEESPVPEEKELLNNVFAD